MKQAKSIYAFYSVYIGINSEHPFIRHELNMGLVQKFCRIVNVMGIEENIIQVNIVLGSLYYELRLI